MRWSDDDRAELARRGVPLEEAERQLALLHHPPAPAQLVRPATADDGVERLSPEREDELVRLGESARDAGRLTKFVPASGAATRMFKALVAVRERLPEATAADIAAHAGETDDAEARDVAAFVEALERLALAHPLAERLGHSHETLLERARTEPLAPILDALLLSEGLDALRLPKALLPFHLREGEARTAFEEQLDEGLAYLVDANRRARYAFTLSPGTLALFERALAAWVARQPGIEIEVAFSEQSPATDTLALDANGEAARTADGRLLFRPAGHGALVDNLGVLARSGGDVALVKNIDNILPAERHAQIGRARLLLAGRLVELERELERRGARDRPARVCGVVANSGEPGGGPFWVADDAGRASLQIVESSQVALRDEAQRSIWNASTHFNPVDLACSLRDAEGRAFDLAAFVDPAASFVTKKSEGGRELTVLERPGLWNGAMARWATVFVELPAWTFAPVKSVLDLARPEHAASPPRP